MASQFVVTTLESSPIADDILETELFRRRQLCCWYWNPPCKSDWERILRSEGGERSSSNGSWCRKRVKALEKFAGPKWQTLIHRFNKTSKCNRSKPSSFGYDPRSYAMNFDGGHVEVDDDTISRSFTVRYSRGD